MASLEVSIDDTIATIAQDVGNLHSKIYDEIHLYVLAFDNLNHQLLLVKQDGFRKASMKDTPNIELIVGEEYTTARPLREVAQELVRSQQSSAELEHTCLLFTGPNSATPTKLNIVVASKIKADSLGDSTWLTERAALVISFYNPELGWMAEKSVLRSLVEWRRNPTKVLALRCTAAAAGKHQKHQRNKIQDLDDAALIQKERFAIQARKIGGKRFKQPKRKCVSCGRKEIMSVGGDRLLEKACKAFKSLPRLLENSA